MMNMKPSNRHTRLMLLPVAFGAVLALASGARGQCQYDVTAVFEGPDGWGGPAPISVTGMNEHGHIVGFYNVIFGDEAFLWTPEEGLVTLPRLPGAGTARAYAINDNDEIVGYSEQSDSNRYTACLWKNGEVIDLGQLPDGNWSEALGINNEGQIVGYSNHGTSGPMRAFLWEDGEMTDLSAILSTEDSVACAISDRGQITGWTGTWLFYDSQAFILDGDDVVDLGVPPYGTGACGWDINERGWVSGIGYADPPGGLSTRRRSVLHRSWKMLDLGTLPGDTVASATEINDRGQVVGHSGTDYRAVLWQNGRTSALDDLVIGGSELTLRIAGGLNQAGQIAAAALNPSAHLVGVLLTPSETAPGDADGDCRVDIDDLFAVLGFWGPCEGCPEDLNEDGVVNIQDLLTVIMNWR